MEKEEGQENHSKTTVGKLAYDKGELSNGESNQAYTRTRTPVIRSGTGPQRTCNFCLWI